NTKVATVSTSGKVKGIKAGTVTITATAKDGSKKKGTYKVTVSKKSKTTKDDNTSKTQSITKPKDKVENKELNVSGSYVDVGIKKTINYTTLYNDYWFSSSSSPSTNNKDLATLSMFASASVYNLSSAVSLLQKCGFNAVQNSIPNTETNNDHVSFVIGSKKIDNFTLVAVIVKGTSGDYEWVSNFNVGKGTTHEGFKLAKNEMKERVSSYINSQNISGTVKYWVTGHSRGAAVANLYAQDLTRTKGSNYVYAYTFATPRVSKSVDASGNIHNYINSGDFVTEVAPKKWGFARNGRDIIITSSELNAMKSTFSSTTGVTYSGFTESSKNELLNLFLKYSGNSQEAYYKKKTYPGKTIAGRTITKGATFSPADFCQQGVGYAMAGNPNGIVTVTKWGLLAVSASDFASKIVDTSGLKSEFAHAHCVSTYVSWLTNLSGNSNVSVSQ
ncbi:MAG: Ig-like domain-containing protein, partial [Bacilli bacterium]|nr:Ig-like domain-containing protein [Bacilli bacterium]